MVLQGCGGEGGDNDDLDDRVDSFLFIYLLLGLSLLQLANKLARNYSNLAAISLLLSVG